jgi:GH18 family chitinase
MTGARTRTRLRRAMLAGGLLLAGQMLALWPAFAATENYAIGETGVLGSQSGDYTRTFVADKNYEQITEQRDSAAEYGLEWEWQFNVIAGDSYHFHVTAQATNSRNGMDFYDFSFRRAEDPAWTPLGTMSTTTLSHHVWSFPVDVSGDLRIRAIDTNRSGDGWSNALRVDHMYVLTSEAASGGGGSSGSASPNTTKAIFGYYPQWGIYMARSYWVRYIPFTRVTHVNYAFANVDAATLQVVSGDTFADFTHTKDSETPVAGNIPQLMYYRAQHPHLKVIISVGGWSWSENFSDAALTPESRWIFAESLKSFVQTHGFDGADIDWEYPNGVEGDCGQNASDPNFKKSGGPENVCRPEDPVNHALLLMACRAKLDELGPGYLLTIALPAGYSNMEKILPPLVDNGRLLDAQGAAPVYMRNPANPAEQYSVGTATTVDMLDYVHVMTYDLAGAFWEDTTRHHSPMYGYEGPSGDPADDPFHPKHPLTKLNSHFAIQGYRFVHDDYSTFDPDAPALDPVSGVGEIDAAKLTLGVPMYGRGWKSVDAGSWDGFAGLFQFTDARHDFRTPKGTWDGQGWANTGVFAYWDILLRHGGDALAAVNNLWRPPAAGRQYGPYTLEGDLFIGFDDQTSMSGKMQYLVDQGLGGVMFWDFAGDLSQAQIDQGVSGAQQAYDAGKMLIHHLAGELEWLAPKP